jgi:tetratricopeptide (TPR) repeat protein
MLAWLAYLSLIYLLLDTQPLLGISIVFGIYILYVSYSFVNSFSLKELKRAIRILDDECDPEKFLEIVNEILAHNISKHFKVVLLINRSVALSHLGKYEESMELLKSIDIDKFPIHPLTKLLYYDNLAGAYFQAGESEKGKTLLEKTEQILLGAMVDRKVKESHMQRINLNKTEIMINENRLDEAAKILLDNLQTNRHKMSTVNINYTLAEIFLKQGKTADAKKHLNFVIENGNKLIMVQEAKEMLADIVD